MECGVKCRVGAAGFQKMIPYRDLRRNAESALYDIPLNSTFFSAFCHVAKIFANTRYSGVLRSRFFVVLMTANTEAIPAAAGEDV